MCALVRGQLSRDRPASSCASVGTRTGQRTLEIGVSFAECPQKAMASGAGDQWFESTGRPTMELVRSYRRTSTQCRLTRRQTSTACAAPVLANPSWAIWRGTLPSSKFDRSRPFTNANPKARTGSLFSETFFSINALNRCFSSGSGDCCRARTEHPT